MSSDQKRIYTVRWTKWGKIVEETFAAADDNEARRIASAVRGKVLAIIVRDEFDRSRQLS